MIFGIGVDVLQMQRMSASYARFGAHLVQRLLLEQEQAQFAQVSRPERFLALRFAAKEAIVKAMGTGFAHGIWIRDVGVVQNRWGKPEIIYSERGERVRRRLGIGEGHVTLTDEAGLIVAVAVLLRATGRRHSASVPAAAARPSGARGGSTRGGTARSGGGRSGSGRSGSGQGGGPRQAAKKRGLRR